MISLKNDQKEKSILRENVSYILIPRIFWRDKPEDNFGNEWAVQAGWLGNCSRIFIKCLEWFYGDMGDEMQHFRCLSTSKIHGKMVFECVLIHSFL